MISLLFSILILVVIIGLAYWIITLIPLPPPFGWIAQAALAILTMIFLIGLLLPHTGYQSTDFLLR